MSETNRVSLKYVPESVYNTTPADSVDWKYTRYTGESLTATTNRQDSAEIRADRHIASSPKVSRQVSGGVDLELSPTTFDDWIEAAMCGTWTADVVEIGTEQRSFSVEKHFEDIGKFEVFTGVRVGQMSLTIPAGGIITGSFQFMGAGETRPATTAVGAGTVAAADTNDIYTGTADIGEVQINGAPTGFCINSMSIDLNNNLREITCIGKEFPSNISYGSATVTGSFDAYLNDELWALFDSVADNDDVSLSFPVTDGTNSYTFFLPRTKISADSPQSGSKDSDVMVSFTFTALLDSVEGTGFRITRATA